MDWQYRWKNGLVDAVAASAIIKELSTVEELSIALDIERTTRNRKGTVQTILDKMTKLKLAILDRPKFRVRGGR